MKVIEQLCKRTKNKMFDFVHQVNEDWIKDQLENAGMHHSALEAYIEIENSGGNHSTPLVEIQKLFLMKLLRKCVAYRWLPCKDMTDIRDNEPKCVDGYENKNVLSKLPVIERFDPRQALSLTKKQVIEELVSDASSIISLIERPQTKNAMCIKKSLEEYMNTHIY